MTVSEDNRKIQKSQFFFQNPFVISRIKQHYDENVNEFIILV